MRLLILGASGGVGSWVTRLAVREGHAVTALVRKTTTYQPREGVSVQRGSVLDPEDMARAVAGQEVVISCIGAQRVNPKNPWSPLRPPGRISERATKLLVEAAKSVAIRRVVVISAAGVGDGADKANAVINWLVRHSTVGEMYADLEMMEAVLAGSGLDWIAVRPVTLINAAPSRRAKVVSRFRLFSVIGRADVAAWLLQTATSQTAIADRTPMIGWW